VLTKSQVLSSLFLRKFFSFCNKKAPCGTLCLSAIFPVCGVGHLQKGQKEMTLDCPFRNPLQSRVIPVRSCYLTSFWLPLFLSDLHNQSIHFLNLLLNDINCSALRIIPHT